LKRTAIITIAGSSSRFSKSVEKEVHKAIYFDKNDSWTILAHQLKMLKDACDEILIVTGYKHREVEQYLKNNFSSFNYKLIYNEHYSDYGSGYSLILAIDAVDEQTDELIFLEGDLIFDNYSFNQIIHTHNNVITANNLPIMAKTAVIFYVNNQKIIKYLYDVNHKFIEINEPFVQLGNSGQVWKFTDIKRLKNNLINYGINEYKGTNLIPINDYYKFTNLDEVEFITFKYWFNCNTIEDFKLMKKYVNKGD
jgi:choline kinase